jgi:hypothetical protein
MMAVKARIFQPMVTVWLEDLVPANHFYRHLERTLDLTFVRDLVRDRYSAFGRPSIDPVVFFKLQLVMFFEGCAPSDSWKLSGLTASASVDIWATTCTSPCLTTPV